MGANMKYRGVRTIEDLLGRAVLAPSGCIEWAGAKCNGGYGRVKFMGHTWGAHRLAWTLVHGPIPDGLCVCHTCDNPSCIADRHLFLGTHQDNMRDMDAKGRRAEAPKGENGYGAKLTRREAKRLIRIRERDGLSVRAAARIIGISKSQAHRIVTGEQWAHLQESVA